MAAEPGVYRHISSFTDKVMRRDSFPVRARARIVRLAACVGSVKRRHHCHRSISIDHFTGCADAANNNASEAVNDAIANDTTHCRYLPAACC
ncbi:hypothetical protein KCP75_14390 [Salmonella enterica subsp. enterica]|nr:hypothetical protein KCP75_14390 [Salmonella enterica subsp. enterica]